jgi:acyl carrier protein
VKAGETVAGVLATVSRTVGVHRLPPDAGPDLELTDGGLWLSSLELVEVIVGCEETFGVVLDPEKDLTPDALRTVGKLAATIEAVRTRTERSDP